jgi:hypothetical protein
MIPVFDAVKNGPVFECEDRVSYHAMLAEPLLEYFEVAFFFLEGEARSVRANGTGQ